MNMRLKKIARKALGRLGYEITRRSDNRPGTSPAELERLRNAAWGQDAIKLHFGCGSRVLKGWLNIDLAYAPYVELKSYTARYYPPGLRGGRDEFFAIDVTSPGFLPIANASVDVVYHEDFIEHIAQRDQFVFLAETLRVLKSGGVHRVNTPDIVRSMSRHSRFAEGARGVYVDEWDRWHHMNVLSPAVLEEMALTVGYSRVLFNKRDASVCKVLPSEFRPASDRSDDENIFADLIK